MFKNQGLGLVGMLVMMLSLSACTTTEDDMNSMDSMSSGSMMQDSKGVNTPTSPIYFAFDKSDISYKGQDSLKQLAKHLMAHPMMKLQVEGHCDNRGTVQYNLALGERRAQSVKNYLVTLGVKSVQVSTISYGQEKPAVDGYDESAWSMNRRAEFVLTK